MPRLPVHVPVYSMVDGDIRLARIVCFEEKEYTFPACISCGDVGALLNVANSIRVSVGENTPLCIVEDELGVVVVYYPPRGMVRVFDSLADCLNNAPGIAPGTFGKVRMPDTVEGTDFLCIETLLVSYAWDFETGNLSLSSADVVPNGHAFVQDVYTGLDTKELVWAAYESRKKLVSTIINGFTLAVLWVDGRYLTYRVGGKNQSDLLPSRRFHAGCGLGVEQT